MAKPKNNSFSPSRRAYRRLRQNTSAFAGLLFIILLTLLAIIAYWVIPDPSPNANDQITDVALEEAGFQISMLKLRKNKSVEKNNLFKRLLHGQPNPHRLIPYNQIEWQQDSVILQRYAGRDQETDTLYKGIRTAFHLLDVAFPLQATYAIRQEADRFYYQAIDKAPSSIQHAQLLEQIQQTQLIKRTYYLGADRFGRSVLSRLILGIRISLLVGLIAVAISLTIGIVLGAVAGYFGGWIDDVILFLINTIWSIPTLILVFAIILALGRGIGIIFLAVGLTMWIEVARIVRGQVLALKKIAFVEAAQSMAFGHLRIIFKHILPNIIGPVMVIAAANFATAILIEAGLSYLGIGVQPPTPSWGTMLNENYGYAIGGRPLLALVPAIAIMLVVLAFNLLGNGLRDALDVKGR